MMRKLPIALEFLSILALLLSFGLTLRALAGPNPLPDKIPTHFDFAGHPDAYGSSLTLFLLPGIALVLYLLMTAVARNPAVFNYPVRVTRHNQQELLRLALNLIALVKAQTLTLLAVIQYQILRLVTHSSAHLLPGLMPIGIAVIFLTVALHIVAMRRVRPR